jgi:MSHA biogenesis protein MshE
VPERPKLGELLVMAGAIDQTQLGAALAEQRRFGRPLGATLVRMGFLDEEGLIRTLARQLKLPIAWLHGKWVEQEVLSALTQLLTVLMQKGIISREEVAERFRDFLPTEIASR